MGFSLGHAFHNVVKSVVPVAGATASGFLSGGFGGAASSALNYLSSSSAASAQNKYNSANTAKQMAFQSDMSNTAHQREVADLEAAGLNPILSGTGGSGASTSPGSTFNSVNAGEAGITSAFNHRMQAKQLKLMDEQIQTTNNQSYLNTQLALKAAQDRSKSFAETTNTKLLTPGLRNEAGIDSSSAGALMRQINRVSGSIQGIRKAGK